MDRACSTHRREEEFIQVLVGKPEEKRTQERPRHRWKDNFKMNIGNI
jgi:hypothetical protein